MNELIKGQTHLQNAAESLGHLVEQGILNNHTSQFIRAMKQEIESYVINLQEEIDRQEANPYV